MRSGSAGSVVARSRGTAPKPCSSRSSLYRLVSGHAFHWTALGLLLGTGIAALGATVSFQHGIDPHLAVDRAPDGCSDELVDAAVPVRRV